MSHGPTFVSRSKLQKYAVDQTRFFELDCCWRKIAYVLSQMPK